MEPRRILSHEVAPGMVIRSATSGREYRVDSVHGGYADLTRLTGPNAGAEYVFSLIEMGREGIYAVEGN